jgi:ATPase family AAA domain-containing protein 3A/B
MLARHLVRPALVRETSRTTGLRAFWDFVSSPAVQLRRGATHLVASLWSRLRGDPAAGPSAARHDERVLEGIIFPPRVRSSISEVALAIARAYSRRAPLRHILLYGPPGTGKTMIARRMAYLSGLDYAIMSGGDLGPLGQAAVSELHLLLSWAKASPRGVLLFIDEAEAALADRRKCSMSEVAQNVLNTVLYHTGEQSTRFMLVLATNRPEDLDEALLDRMDEVIEVPLPGEAERAALLEMYYESFIGARLVERQPKSGLGALWRRVKPLLTVQPNPIMLDAFDSKAACKKLSSLTAGFSGREISKLMLSVRVRQGLGGGGVASPA